MGSKTKHLLDSCVEDETWFIVTLLDKNNNSTPPTHRRLAHLKYGHISCECFRVNAWIMNLVNVNLSKWNRTHVCNLPICSSLFIWIETLRVHSSYVKNRTKLFRTAKGVSTSHTLYQSFSIPQEVRPENTHIYSNTKSS